MFIRQVQMYDAIKMLHFFHKKLIKLVERWGDNLDLIDRKVGQWREVQTVWNPPSFSADEMTPFPPDQKVKFQNQLYLERENSLKISKTKAEELWIAI